MIRKPDVCQACRNRVYILERLIIENKLYHRTCFKCCRCQSLLKPGSYVNGPKTGQYECASCPDEEEAEKAAIASMTAARLAHINSPVSPESYRTLIIKSPTKAEDVKLSLAIADARKVFLSQTNEKNNTPVSVVTTDSVSSHSCKETNQLNTVSPYLFGVKEKEQLEKQSSNGIKLNKDTTSTISALSLNKSINVENESKIDKQNSSERITQIKLDIKPAQLSIFNTEEQTSVESKKNNEGRRKEKLDECHPSPTSDSNNAYNQVRDKTHEESKDIEQESCNKYVRPVPSPRSFHKKQTLSSTTGQTNDKQLEEMFVTPQASPEAKSQKPKFDFQKHEQTVEITSSADEKKEKIQPLSPSAVSVHQSRFPSSEIPVSPSKAKIVVHDMPIIQPQISHQNLSPSKEKENRILSEEIPHDCVDSESPPKENEKTSINKEEIEEVAEMNHSNEITTCSLENSEKNDIQTDDDHLSVEASLENSVVMSKEIPLTVKKESLPEMEEKTVSPSNSRKKLIPPSSLSIDLKSPSKKTPPPRPQLPSILMKSPVKTSPVATTRSTIDYPQNLNPFGGDDEENEEQASNGSVNRKETDNYEKSLNPFEDSEDEYEDALKPEDLVTSTPKKIVSESVESHRERTKIEVPKGLNPFEDEEEEETTGDDSSMLQLSSKHNDDSHDLHAQIQSSDSSVLSSKERPTPLPRRSVGTRSSSQSPVNSLGRASGLKYASASSSPVGSLGKASGKRHTLSGGSSPAVSPVNSLSKATGQRCVSRDSGLDVSPLGSLSRNKKKRPAPKPPSARILFNSTESRTTTIENEDGTGSISTPLPKLSPSPHKKLPAPPPPVSLNNKNNEMSEKTLKDLDNINLKSARKDSIKNERISLTPNDNLNESSPVKGSVHSKNTFGYWKKKKPAPPIPLPPKRQIAKLPWEDIQHELSEIETKQLDLEQRGVELEKKIREGSAYGDDTNGEDEDLVLQLFELVNQKNILFRRQAELVYMNRQQRLEEEHAELEFQIRCLMDKPVKSEEETEREEELIKRLIDVVAQRNEIIESIEIDRVKEAMEDESIQEQMAVHQGSSRSSLNSQGSTNSMDHLGKKEKKKKEKEAKKVKSKEKEKTKVQDEDKDLDDTELTTKEKMKKEKKRKWF